jgi:hypothetical protein
LIQWNIFFHICKYKFDMFLHTSCKIIDNVLVNRACKTFIFTLNFFLSLYSTCSMFLRHKLYSYFLFTCSVFLCFYFFSIIKIIDLFRNNAYDIRLLIVIYKVWTQRLYLHFLLIFHFSIKIQLLVCTGLSNFVFFVT